MKKIVLSNTETPFGANSEDLAKVLIMRLGLNPRKKGSNDTMHRLLLEFYERAKRATKEKKPELAVLTVEEMAIHVGITKQTMYEYLERWISIEIITKVTFIDQNSKVVHGYKLNGSNLEEAFSKMQSVVINNMHQTKEIITELQKKLKNEKIAQAMKENQTEKSEL